MNQPSSPLLPPPNTTNTNTTTEINIKKLQEIDKKLN